MKCHQLSRPLLLCIIACAACGGRHASTAQDGALTVDGSQTVDQAIGKVDQALPAGNNDCVVAIRTDNCCTSAQPVRRSQLQADPCLVEVAPSLHRMQWVASPSCRAKWTENCELIDCISPPPASRIVKPDANGVCRFVDECQSDSDCFVGSYNGVCCPCAEGFPLALKQHQCVSAIGQPTDPSCKQPLCAQACLSGEWCVPNGGINGLPRVICASPLGEAAPSDPLPTEPKGDRIAPVPRTCVINTAP